MFFLLAATTLRMRCFSMPYLCIFAGAAVANFDLYKWIAIKIGDVRNKNIVNLLRHIVVVFAIVLLFLTKKESIYKVGGTAERRKYTVYCKLPNYGLLQY